MTKTPPPGMHFCGAMAKHSNSRKPMRCRQLVPVDQVVCYWHRGADQLAAPEPERPSPVATAAPVDPPPPVTAVPVAQPGDLVHHDADSYALDLRVGACLVDAAGRVLVTRVVPPRVSRSVWAKQLPEGHPRATEDPVASSLSLLRDAASPWR